MTRELSTPPSHPVEWQHEAFRTQSEHGSTAIFVDAPIVAKTWFDARAKACVLYGCGPEDVTVRPK